jgi:uncharacterized protein (DUF2141 family)
MANSKAIRFLALSAALLPCLAQTPSGARIEGVVVDTISGTPLRRAAVQLRLASSAQALSIESADYAEVTGPDGTFHFDRLPPGSYSLSCSRSGYLVPRISTGYSSLVVTAAAGETVKGLRYGLIPQSIVSGRVVDDEGDPVEGVQVTLLAFRYSGGIRRLTPMSQTGTTNDRGEYRVSRLPAGKYFVQASPERPPSGSPLLAAARTPGSPLVSYGSTFYPGATDSGQALRVELHGGQELSGLDIPLQRTALVRVSGRLIGPDGMPMQRASVMLISAQSHLPTGFGVQADEAGSFVLNNVRSGSYLLNAFSRDNRALSVPLEVGSTDISGFVAQTSPPVSVRGSVTVESSSRNFSLASVSVSLRLVDSGAVVALARPTSDGAFSLEKLQPGRYIAEVFCGASGAYVQSISVGGEEVRGRDFDLSAAAGGLRIVLRPDSAKLTGTVDSPDGATGHGEGQGHPAVILIPADSRLRGVDVVAPARVSSKNSFDFSGLRPGEYLAIAFDDIDESQLQDPEFLLSLDPLGRSVQLSPGATQTVTLKWSAWPQTAGGY